MNIGFMQSRLIPSDKKNSIQYFPSKNWIKEIKIAKKNKSKITKCIKSKVPSNKFCSPKQICDLCNLLMLNDSNFVGSNIVMDGGQTL